MLRTLESFYQFTAQIERRVRTLAYYRTKEEEEERGEGRDQKQFI